jgi:type VI secretion system protein ImpK
LRRCTGASAELPDSTDLPTARRNLAQRDSMMAQNPFSEPQDDRTVIRPTPGGRRAGDRDRTVPATSQQPGLSSAEALPTYPIGSNRLLAAAEPLVLLLARLRTGPIQPLGGDLRASVLRALRGFEQRGREAGVPMEQLRPAHHALCASIDDLMLNTPWGGATGWHVAPLAATLHQDTTRGERFLAQLRQFCRAPGTWLPVLELMYVCLSLGFMGPFRGAADGAIALEDLRRHTHGVITRERGNPGPALSADWAGVSAPYRPSQARIPVWVIGSVGAAAIAGRVLWCRLALNGASDRLYAQMIAAPPASMPLIVRAALVRPPPPALPATRPGTLELLRQALRHEVDNGMLTVFGSDTSAVLRIPAATLFPPAGAVPLVSARPLLEHLAVVLKSELADGEARLQVNGYTDNQPVRTVRFPSNFRLSAARAEAVRDLLQRTIGSAPAIAAEGRADADPIAGNTTEAGREQNRRIEIVLRRQP